ncbi:MAG: ribosome assembly RNA-binding protein YhbY [Gammaproteobacteria bacterium]|nr:MAG: ribosome assembly RNA-binding protein YhbY [Gammaproteobacteria bacterium]
MESLSQIQKKHLKKLGHNLDPVVRLGNAGFTEAVLKEIKIALDHHELIKVKIPAEREERKEIATKICEETGAFLIHNIGHIILIFKRNHGDPKIELPKKK